ncbi:hypothetical protein KO500_05125 [Cellulophaga baltica]|uniref:hypothetical protein n=1 Tax=Cellulophaga TaxID=104264 RepID=UPI001C06ABAD|nr:MULTISPECIES: hypothetical protein [Cellulophaga]MBU2995802.1 hypothetical protein [Cellulophaga baltica]MDO6767197.1 hypothetical protein [Cellulophaga sp. 1_MG-2023]
MNNFKIYSLLLLLIISSSCVKDEIENSPENELQLILSLEEEELNSENVITNVIEDVEDTVNESTADTGDQNKEDETRGED